MTTTLASDLMASGAMHMPACWVLSCASVLVFFGAFRGKGELFPVIVLSISAAGAGVEVRHMAPGPSGGVHFIFHHAHVHALYDVAQLEFIHNRMLANWVR